MYYIYGISGPSLLIESTDSMIYKSQRLSVYIVTETGAIPRQLI